MLKVNSVVVGIPSIRDEAEASELSLMFGQMVEEAVTINSLYYYYDRREGCYHLSLKYIPSMTGKHAVSMALDMLLHKKMYTLSHVPDVWVIGQSEVAELESLGMVLGFCSLVDEAELHDLAISLALEVQGRAKLNSLYYYDEGTGRSRISIRFVPQSTRAKKAIDRACKELLKNMQHTRHIIRHLYILEQSRVDVESGT